MQHLPELSTLREDFRPVASPLEKLPEGLMSSFRYPRQAATPCASNVALPSRYVFDPSSSKLSGP